MQGTEAQAEVLPCPVAIEFMQIMLLLASDTLVAGIPVFCYFFLFGRGSFNAQIVFTCLLFMQQLQPVLASQEDANSRPGLLEWVSLIIAIVSLHLLGVKLMNLLDAYTCLLYTSPSPRDRTRSRMPSSA